MSDSDVFMDEVIDEVNTGAKSLPQFLNVLTILTFIGSGLGLLSNVYSFFTISANRAQIEQSMAMMEDMGDNNPMAGMMDGMMEDSLRMLDNGPALYASAIVAAIFCLLGAFLMRKLKKTGFYAYVVGCLVGIVAPIAIVGMGSGFTATAFAVGAVISIVFIIMYGVNLKHLK